MDVMTIIQELQQSGAPAFALLVWCLVEIRLIKARIAKLPCKECER